MRAIDMTTWPRRRHFELYSAFDHPHFGMSAPVDITAFRRAVKEAGQSLTLAISYVLSRAANGILEFRYRIRGDQVVEHDVVHPSITILTNDDLFSFVTFDYGEGFPAFAAAAEESVARVRDQPTLEDQPGRDDLLFMTAIPWVSFTSFTHPMHLDAPDSIPRFAWGKFYEDGGRLRMPLNVQAHHALMDGLHVARFYKRVEDTLDSPTDVLS